MKINSINCCKPRPRNSQSFTGNNEQAAKPNERKVLCKHYWEMNNEDLALASIAKAHKQIKKSPKALILKAMPEITAGIIGTSLALTQPGKLSSKVATGLGFLALAEGTKFANKKIEEQNSKEDNLLKPILKLGVFALGAFAAVKGIQKFAPSVAAFAKKQVSDCAKEINSTKLAKFNSKVVNPFVKKHQKIATALGFATSVATAALAPFAKQELSASLSKDFKEQAEYNFLKGKAIQKQVREHYDSIDAKEF